MIILHMCTKNYDYMMQGSRDMVSDGRTDGQTNRRKTWHIEVGAPPKKYILEFPKKNMIKLPLILLMYLTLWPIFELRWVWWNHGCMALLNILPINLQQCHNLR